LIGPAEARALAGRITESVVGLTNVVLRGVGEDAAIAVVPL